MPVTLKEFAAKARDLGKTDEINAVLESVENQLFEIMEEMRHKGVVFEGTRSDDFVTAYGSLFSGVNKQTQELRNIAHSLVRMQTADSLFTEEDKKIIGNAAFDDVVGSIVDRDNPESALGIHHRIFAAA